MFTRKLILPLGLLFTLSACQSVDAQHDAVAADTEANKQAEHRDGSGWRERKQSRKEQRRVRSEAGREHFIEEHDLHGDGQVSLVEFIEFRTDRFNGGDRSGDGVLSKSEYVDEYAARLDRQLENERQGHQEQTRARFNALDASDSGYITWAEFSVSSDRIFARLDPDNTGRIEMDPDAEDDNRRSRRNHLAMPTTHRLSGFMELYDEDASGVVTREEFDRQRRAQFDRTDRDGSGRISPDEYMDEFMARVDRRSEQVRESQLRQAGVRFAAVDLNDDGVIDLSEYIAVGLRSFLHWDANDTGIVSAQDPLPKRSHRHSRSARQNIGDDSTSEASKHGRTHSRADS